MAILMKLPTKIKNSYALTIQTNGTTQTTYDGSATKTVNITPSNIGAAVSSHSHTNYSTATNLRNGSAPGSIFNGYDGGATGTNAIATGYNSVAAGASSIAMGYICKTNESFATAIGNKAVSNGGCSFGANTLSDKYNMAAVGVNNKAGYDGFDKCYLVVGNVTSIDGNRSNGLRVAQTSVYGAGNFIASGADYAEYFEWEDGNIRSEDRVGLFVTMQGTKIKKAEKGDYVLGIVSALPCIIGNGDENWLGRWLLDDYGRFLTKTVDKPIKKWKEITREDMTKEWIEVETGEYETIVERVENPEYEKTKSYIERKDRKEWDPVGMLGVLSVRDDGTCQVNSYCTVADGGIATATEDKTGYRVIERITDNIIKIIFR